MQDFADARRILIFRLGSLGDNLAALPALHLLARRFPRAERRVLTNFHLREMAAPMSALLDGSGLVQGYFRYPSLREGRALLSLVRDIRRWGPDLLIHMHEPRGRAVALRDAAFFRACGIRRMAGVPYAPELAQPRLDPATGLYEHKAALLARRLAPLGDCALDDPASWDLRLSAAETDRALALLAPLAGVDRVLAMSIGAKTEVQNWGDANWSALLRHLASRLPGWGLVALGVESERARSEALLGAWTGPQLNLCGRTSQRDTAAVLRSADLYLGHDSGPMHLAATMGTPCVAIFSAHDLPGEWFPRGEGHRVLYKKTECHGCRLSECRQFAKQCILSIGVEETAAAVLASAGHV